VRSRLDANPATWSICAPWLITLRSFLRQEWVSRLLGNNHPKSSATTSQVKQERNMNHSARVAPPYGSRNGDHKTIGIKPKTYDSCTPMFRPRAKNICNYSAQRRTFGRTICEDQTLNIASKTFCSFFRIVEIYPLIVQKEFAPP
jgi:hypothetical protein